MGAVFAAFFAWVIFSYIFAAVFPLALQGIAYAIGFLLLCAWETAKLLGRLLFTLGWLLFASPARGLWWLAGRIERGVHLGALFLIFIVEEWWRGPGAEEQEDGHAGGGEQATGETRYAAALARFGLPPEFTRADLDRAYKHAIRKAHPDAGGSLAEAQAVNADRDLLMSARGWV